MAEIVLSVPRMLIKNKYGVPMVLLGFSDGSKDSKVYGFVPLRDLEDASSDYFYYNEAPTKDAPKGDKRAQEFRLSENAYVRVFGTDEIKPRELKASENRDLPVVENNPGGIVANSCSKIKVSDLDRMNRAFLSGMQRNKSVKENKDRNNRDGKVYGAFRQKEFTRTDGDAVIGVREVHRVKSKSGGERVRADLGQLNPDGSVSYISVYVKPECVSCPTRSELESEEFKAQYMGRKSAYLIHLDGNAHYMTQAKNSMREEIKGLNAVDVADRNNKYFAKKFGMLPRQAAVEATRESYEVV